MTLHDLLVRSAATALSMQDPDGSLPPGHNGPYGHEETAARNTGHWLVTFCAATRWTDEERFRDAAAAAARALCSEKLRPGGASFHHRSRGNDSCNGLIGQAWSIEALAEAADTLEAPHLSELAERVFLMHPFDAHSGLWRRLEIDATSPGWDDTFNHQLWFAAAGALLAPLASTEVAARVARFVDRLDTNLALHPSGLIRQAVSPRAFTRCEPRTSLALLRARRSSGPELCSKEAGYHAFNLYALALLRRHVPDHAFWGGRKFAMLWHFALGDEHRRTLESSVVAWPYNPVGIEMAYALGTFEGPGAQARSEEWLAEQLRRHWDPERALLCRDTPDPATLAARLYEAARLPDLALPAELGR